MSERSEAVANRVDKRGDRNDWRTPGLGCKVDIVSRLLGTFPHGFLDPCAPLDGSNPTKAAFCLTEVEDGLKVDWLSLCQTLGLDGVYVNPPFNGMRAWAKKIGEESRRGLGIILMSSATSRCGTLYMGCEVFNFHRISALPATNCRLCDRHQDEPSPLRGVCHPQGRVPFIDAITGNPAAGNSLGSVLYALGAGLNFELFRVMFQNLGPILVQP